MKIGFYGGCFNPPTNAHMAFAKGAIEKYNLDKVIFVPMGDSYEKKNLARAEERLKMLEIAIAKMKNLEISDIEIKENKKLSTYDAFKMFESLYSNDDVFFLMGADSFIKLVNNGEMHDLRKFKCIVFERDGFDVIHYLKDFPNVMLLENKEHKNKSASEFRNLIKNGNINQDIVPKEVLDYIIENKIY